MTWPVGCLLNPVRYVLGKAALFWKVLSRAGRRLGFIFHSDTVMERMSLSAPCPCAQNKGVTINSFILFGWKEPTRSVCDALSTVPLFSQQTLLPLSFYLYVMQKRSQALNIFVAFCLSQYVYMMHLSMDFTIPSQFFIRTSGYFKLPCMKTSIKMITPTYICNTCMYITICL